MSGNLFKQIIITLWIVGIVTITHAQGPDTPGGEGDEDNNDGLIQVTTDDLMNQAGTPDQGVEEMPRPGEPPGRDGQSLPGVPGAAQQDHFTLIQTIQILIQRLINSLLFTLF